MTLWLVFLVMAAMPSACSRCRCSPPGNAARAGYDIALYRDQLDEIEREVSRGVIAPRGRSARAEIGRRLLAASERHERQIATSLTTRRSAALVLAVIVPLAALALYVDLGAPMVPDQPFAARHGQPAIAAEQLAKLTARLAELEAKVKADPRDVESWVEIARLDAAHERYREAADAFGKAYEIAANAPALAIDYAEALVLADRGVVGARAKELFQAGLAAEPRSPRAHFYLGLAHVQTGDVTGGLQEWLELQADSPADAPWVADARRAYRQRRQGQRHQRGDARPHARRRAGGSGRPRQGRRSDGQARRRHRRRRERGQGARHGHAGRPNPPDTTKQEAAKPGAAKPEIGAAGKSTPAGPTEAEIEAAGKMKKEDQVAMVRGMVDRLAERLKTNPDDMAGWRRLGRSYLVLGEADKASDALAHAAALAPKNVDVLLDYGEAVLNAAGPALAPTDRLPAKFLEIMNRVYALDDNNPVALWYLGVDHAQAGRRDEAAALWTRLMERLPPNAPERAALAKRLEMLKIDRKPEK